MNPEEDILETWQRRTDRVSAATFERYLLDGNTRRLAALRRLEDAFDRVLREVRETEVGDVPAVWCVYNMGVVVKTRESLFSIDLHHRRAAELAPLLDFALITHNHDDHWRPDFYRAMDRAGKTVVSNFLSNFGAADWTRGGADWAARGGYARTRRTLRVRDAEIRASTLDHNGYLVDFTTAFEITVGDFTIFHSGDCSSVGKLKCECPNPDLWMFHPYCGLDAVKGAEALKPKLAVVAHLNELGHAKDRWRWTWSDGARARKNLEAAGFAATVPLWGDRIV
jgi:L-ascorbate metabolism protein UlaG (beta-lactamase superfamily)